MIDLTSFNLFIIIDINYKLDTNIFIEIIAVDIEDISIESNRSMDFDSRYLSQNPFYKGFLAVCFTFTIIFIHVILENDLE